MAAEDTFRNFSEGLTSPARNVEVVTPADGTDLINVSREVYVGSAGDLTVDMLDGGTNVTFVNVPAGSRLPYRVTRVYATGTTASDIVSVF